MNDKTNTIQELKDQVHQFQLERGWNPDVRELAISIMIEAAELLEHFQWNNRDEQDSREEIEKELADVVIYVMQFVYSFDLDLTTAVTKKLKHNAKKYPVEKFSPGKLNSKEYYAIKKKYRGQ